MKKDCKTRRVLLSRRREDKATATVKEMGRQGACYNKGGAMQELNSIPDPKAKGEGKEVKGSKQKMKGRRREGRRWWGERGEEVTGAGGRHEGERREGV